MTEEQFLAECGQLLREAREAIDRYSINIGTAQRRRERVGRKVSQEEMGEILGIDRAHYSRIETGSVRPSRELVHAATEILGLRGTARAKVSSLPFSRSDFRNKTGLSRATMLFVRRIVAASTLEEAIERACEGVQIMIRPDVTAMTAMPGHGFAVGPADNAVNDVTRQVINLVSGTVDFFDDRVAVSQGILPPNERYREDEPAYFTLDNGKRIVGAYPSMEMWSDGLGKLRIRTAMHLTIKERRSRYGLISCGWRDNYEPTPYEVDVIDTLGGLVNKLAEE